MTNVTQKPETYSYPEFGMYNSNMIVFWGASPVGHTYGVLKIDKDGNVLDNKRVYYGSIDADVVNN